jgi:hypothetical protein
VLRDTGSKTFSEFYRRSLNVPYKFVATAVPDPNDHIEILNYAMVLGVMDIGEAKTRFFRRNSEKSDALTLHPHKVDEFWLWVSTWACFIQRPSDLGYSDEGYELPPLDVQWHRCTMARSTPARTAKVRAACSTTPAWASASSRRRRGSHSPRASPRPSSSPTSRQATPSSSGTIWRMSAAPSRPRSPGSCRSTVIRISTSANG